eukprot:TRINITY_DN1157_c0_g3_i1.p1 TRINITY_DN1157_c0_g3~~TRINITY_DN1157_c0_g3_i1.p1  ORF type:complete len:181 (+),score=23.21 TRINITY_DN1157_c0_g3_i1:64-606(+)
MAYFQSPVKKTKATLHKKRLSQNQLELLESSFNYSNRLDPKSKMKLSQELGLQPRQIAVWYQNKRARWKTQVLERDHKALRMKLDDVVEEKRQLENYVGRLTIELEKAYLMLGLKGPPLPSSFSASYEEDATSSRHSSGLNSGWEDGGAPPQIDELYACLVGVDGPVRKLNFSDIFGLGS